jgi:hypothetical protein
VAKGTVLTRAVREIARALTKFATESNWNDEDYGIYFSIKSEWDQIYIIFVSKAFDAGTDFANYAAVQQFLNSYFAAEPQILNHLNLSVRSSRQVEQGGIYAIGPDYQEYWTMSRR